MTPKSEEPDKVFYSWEKRDLKRIEIFDGSVKKPSIPTCGRFARIHDEILRKRGKKKRNGPH